ncbi:MAG: mechanosensitive ion channel family protein [Chloroflexota bacterium]|nr:mechanosensitive ion channel family protein [Chloroflexota bacterium]
MPDSGQIADWLQRHGILTLVLLVVAVIVVRAARPMVHRALLGVVHRRRSVSAETEPTADELAKRVATIEDLVVSALRFAVIVAIVLVLLTWIDLLPVIAGFGVILAALTLAGQSIVLDYLMGILIVLEGPYYKGDWVQIGGAEGEVEEIGLRRTTLRDASGTVHSVSNGLVRVASNLTRVYARMQVDLTVPFGTDLDEATRVANDVGRAMADDPEWNGRVLEPPTLTRVPGVSELGPTIRVAGKVRAADRWEAPSELRKRLLAAFPANGIVLPASGQVGAEPDPGRVE